MTTEALSEIIGTAVVDPDFRRALLADPTLAVAGFDLTPGEQQALARCQTGSLVEFATGVHAWLSANETAGESCQPGPEAGFWRPS